MSNARDIADAGHQLAAWVNFNGTGTVAIRASYNVASITDNGTGDYTVNFTTAMPDANYAVATSARGTETGSYGRIATSAHANNTTSTRVICVHSRDWTVQNMTTVTVAIFR